MPIGSKFLHFALQAGKFIAWFEVVPAAPAMTRDFFIVGTGQPVHYSLEYLSTCMDGDFVWHLYERKPSR